MGSSEALNFVVDYPELQNALVLKYHIKDGVNQSLLEMRRALSFCIYNTHLVHIMTYGDQPMGESVFFVPRRVWYHITDRGEIKMCGCFGRVRSKNPRVRRTFGVSISTLLRIVSNMWRAVVLISALLLRLKYVFFAKCSLLFTE